MLQLALLPCQIFILLECYICSLPQYTTLLKNYYLATLVIKTTVNFLGCLHYNVL